MPKYLFQYPIYEFAHYQRTEYRGMMVVEEPAYEAAPKGQANLANSQAKEPQPDRTLERTPPVQEGVTDGEPVRQISQVETTETGKMFFLVFFYF